MQGFYIERLGIELRLGLWWLMPLSTIFQLYHDSLGLEYTCVNIVIFSVIKNTSLYVDSIPSLKSLITNSQIWWIWIMNYKKKNKYFYIIFDVVWWYLYLLANWTFSLWCVPMITELTLIHKNVGSVRISDCASISVNLT
jgi:hypothetical protein